MNSFLSKSVLAAGFALALAFTGCSSDDGDDDSGKTGTFTDSRDGTVYKTVKIGKQTWFAENLSYKAAGAKCYGEDGEVEVGSNDYAEITSAQMQANCNTYGRLYKWETANNACPEGWHLPSKEEFEALVKHVGEKPGKKLKATSGWEYGNGTDEYGFAALPGGYGNSESHFRDVGGSGDFWSSTESSWEASSLHISSYDLTNVTDGDTHVYPTIDKSYLYSVRCIKD